MATLRNSSQKSVDQGLTESAPLNMSHSPKNTIRTLKIAILVAPGVDGRAIGEMKKALVKEGAKAEIIAPQLG